MGTVVDSRSLGLYCSQVGSSALRALKLLKQKGFGAYVAGGCVRDLLLHKPPKDFDLVTTANLMEVRKHFKKLGRTMIVGRRFPICLVYISGAWIEVSSFETVSKHSVENQFTPQKHVGCDPEDRARWENCMKRDFTINSLLYDPYSNKIYDYVKGLNDMRASKVRTVVPAHISFREDCARILRGIRIAARLGLDFSEETQAAILDCSSLIPTLSKARLSMEMNYMLAYGAAVPSIHLLQRFKLLEILLPFQASYLTHHEASEGGQSSSLLMDQKRSQTSRGVESCSCVTSQEKKKERTPQKLFSHLDELLAVDHPSDCKLWLALLAFHLALMKCPENALTIWTFCSILYYGERVNAVNFARSNVTNTNCFPEILDSSEAKTDDLLLEDASRFASVVKSSLHCLTSYDDSMEALKRYPQSSSIIGTVFVSQNMVAKVSRVFDIFFDETSTNLSRTSCSVDYRLLKDGDVSQVRLSLGKVIMNTLCSRNNNEGKQAWVSGGEGQNRPEGAANLERLEERQPVYRPLQVENNVNSKNKIVKGEEGFERRDDSANLKQHGGKKLQGTGTTKLKKRKLTLIMTEEKKPANKPLQAEKSVNSDKEMRKNEEGSEKMENPANLRRHGQDQATCNVEGVGSLHSGSDMKQKIQTVMESSGRGRSSKIKQEKNSDYLVRGDDRSQ